MTETVQSTDATALIDALAEAHEAYERRRERVAEIGERELRALAEAHDEATTLLDRYESRATGTGDFEAFVTFQSVFAEHVEDLPEDLPKRAVFERAGEALDKRRLTERDFEHAREVLDEVNELATRLTERETARERYRNARRAVLKYRNDLDDRIEELERVQRFGEADLDASVGELKEPIVAYDEAVEGSFARFRREESAQVVLNFVAATAAYPLVSFRQPPDDLQRYVEESEAGTEPIPKLLEYAGYSPSKLDHYVADSRELKRHVATHRTYLEDLDADSLTIGWPPPPPGQLWWRARELVSVLSRFAPEDVLTRLRQARALARDRKRYERLREAALAREALDTDARERLRSGAVTRDRETLHAERERVAEALSTYPAL